MNTGIKFANFKIFQNNDKKYIYCVKDNKIFEIDNKTLALLNQEGKTYKEIKNNLSSLFSKEELNEIIKAMYDYGIIENRSQKLKNDSNQMSRSVSSIILLVAQDCNLRCSYCYADEGKYHNSGKMDIEVAKKSVDFLIHKSENEKLGICFFGGEPLLNFKLIKEVVDYCHNREKETNKKFGFSMTSNGTLINNEIEEFIIKNNINLQISIDGDKKIHDYNRYYNKKIGSYETVLKRTKSLREKGLLDARATITTKELNLVYIYNFLNSIGFNQVALSPAFNLFTVKDYDIMADAFIKFYLNFEKYIKEKKYKEVKNNIMFMSVLRDIHNSKIRKTACGAGNNMYAIDINGDIYPCQRFVGSKKVCLGSVFKDDNKQQDFLKKTMINNFKKCSSCWIQNLCVGGCTHDNFSSTGYINAPYEPHCKYKKKIITEAIKIYLRLSDEEINELFKN